MKNLLLILITFIITTVYSFSQTKPMDFFGKSKEYCLYHLHEYKVITTDYGDTAFITMYEGYVMEYIIKIGTNKVVAIIFYYGNNKNLRKQLIKAWNEGGKRKNVICNLTCEASKIPVNAKHLKGKKIVIIC